MVTFPATAILMDRSPITVATCTSGLRLSTPLLTLGVGTSTTPALLSPAMRAIRGTVSLCVASGTDYGFDPFVRLGQRGKLD
jgi:hypothetical protein